MQLQLVTWKFFSVFNNSRCVSDGPFVAGTGIVIPLVVVLLIFVVSTLFLAWKLHTALKTARTPKIESVTPNQEVLYRAHTLSTDTIQDNKNSVNEIHPTEENSCSIELPQTNKDSDNMPPWPEAETTDSCLSVT